jgi:putative FmdB family regulatory protein
MTAQDATNSEQHQMSSSSFCLLPSAFLKPMPTYEYKCEACGHAFEKFQSIKAAPIRKCPNCGKLKVKKLISKGAGLIFKGSGFYITDYRSEAYKGDAAKSESAAKGEAPKTDGGKTDGGKGEGGKSEAPASTESKPATKSESSPRPEAPATNSKPAEKASKSAKKK